MTRLRSGSRSSFAARAKLSLGWAELRRGLEAVAAANSPAITAPADERSAASRYWASSTKTRLSLVADCRLETLVTVMELSPRRRQPRFSARSRRVCFMALYGRFPGCVCTTSASLPLAAAAELRSAWTGEAPVPTQPHELSTAGAGLGGGVSSGGGPIATGRDSGG